MCTKLDSGMSKKFGKEELRQTLKACVTNTVKQSPYKNNEREHKKHCAKQQKTSDSHLKVKN